MRGDIGGEETAELGERIGRRGFLKAAGVGLGGLALGTGTATATGSGVTKQDIDIPSYDGTTIATTLYTPAESGPNPAILMTHGWGGFRQSPITAPKAQHYAENGYVVLTYDSRGFYGSDGTSNLNGPQEVKDARRLVDWLAERPEVETESPGNPKVGMDGISYAGGIQPLVASADPRIDAIVPRITWNDLTYSMIPHGAVKLSWLSIMLGLGIVGTFGFEGESELTDKLYDWYQHTLWNNEPPEAAIEGFEDRSLAYIDDFDTPAFFIQGWDDTLFKPNEALASYRKLQNEGTETRLAFYEGGHAIEEIAVPLHEREYMNNKAVTWMDRHLRGKDVDIPKVQTFIKQDETWRESEQFPPADVSMESYGLGSASEDGDATIEQWSWWYDDEVTYEWTISEDVEVVGTPEFEITVDVEGDEAILYFDLLDDGDDFDDLGEAVGEAYRIEQSGTHTVTFDYPTFQRYFHAGDTLGLRISVSDPLYNDSWDSDGVTIDPAESEIRLPQRPTGSGNSDEQTRTIEDGTYKLTNVNSGKVLDIEGTSTDNGASCLQWDWADVAWQRWKVEHLGNGEYRIVNEHSGKVADVAAYAEYNGGDIHQWDWHGNANQKWRIEALGDGEYKIQSVHSGKVLDVEASSEDGGGNVHQWGWHAGDNQRWRLERLD